MVTDVNGNVISFHDFMAYGQELSSGYAGRTNPWGSSADNADEKFTNQLRDNESGLDYFRARYYSSPMGRFLCPDPGNAGSDPGNPQSWNAYSYVGNRPLVNVDPTGESFWSILGDIFSVGLNSSMSSNTLGEWASLAGNQVWNDPPPSPQVDPAPMVAGLGILPGESGGIPSGLASSAPGFATPCDFGARGSGVLPASLPDPTFPDDPSGVGPEWTVDLGHQDPNGIKWTNGDRWSLEWDQGQVGKPGWRGKNHWHLTSPNDPGSRGRHYDPGDQSPIPVGPSMLTMLFNSVQNLG